MENKMMKIHSDSRIQFPEKDWTKSSCWAPESVPMNLLNEEQAQTNHGQSLDTLNKRGGLGILEILDNIHKRRLSQRKESWADVQELNTLIKNMNEYPYLSFSTREGWLEFYNYLREERKFGKTEFRIAFQDGVHFIVHPVGKDGKTLDQVLTHNDVI